MTLPRVLVVARRVLAQLRRDKRTLVLIVVQPILIISIFGYAFGGDVVGARVAIANLDRGELGQKIIHHMNQTTVIVVLVSSDAEALQAMQQGRASVGVVIPANYTSNYEASKAGGLAPSLLKVYEDWTDSIVTSAVLGALSEAVADALNPQHQRAPGFAFDETWVYGHKTGGELDFLVPGIAAFTIFQLGSLLTVITLVKERTLGTLPRVLATPVRRWEIVLGYTLAFLVLSLVQSLTILVIATLIFGVKLQGSILLAVLATLLVALVALGFGILISGLARSEFQATQAVFLATFPNLFLAGIFAPIESIPPIIRPVTHFVPLYYAVQALRAIINRGRGFESIAPDLGVLALFAAGFLLIATVSFARKS